MKKLICLTLVTVALAGCAKAGFSPEIKVRPDSPTVATNLDPYFSKRAVVLAFRAPEQERGLGGYMASRLLGEMVAAGPFAMVGNGVNHSWFGLDPKPQEEMASAAAIASGLGYDIAIFGDVEQFIYSRNSESRVIVLMNVVDANTGLLIHQQRIIVTGYVGYIPPVWDPSNYKAVNREELFETTVATLVRRMHVRWWEGQTEADVTRDWMTEEEEEALEEEEGTRIGG